MPKFIIEREIPGLGQMSAEELRTVSQKSNKVLADLGPEIQWQQSYATADKLYCIYIASSEDIVYEHARCGGFPANTVSLITAVVDPTTGD